MTRIRRIAVAGLGACAAMMTMAGPAGAITWRQVNTGTTESITAIDYRSPTQVRFTTGGGSIFVRRPDGSFGAEASFPGRQFLDIAFRPSGDVGLAAADSGQLFRFANGAWAPVSLADTSVDHDCPSTPQPPYARSTPTANVVAVAWSSDAVAWATTAGYGQVLKSVDGGATWVDASRLPDGTCRVDAAVTDIGPITGSDADVYFVANGGVWRTIDGLASPASFRSSPLATCHGNPMRVAIDPANPNRLSTAGPCLFNWAVSLDAATSFKPIDPGHSIGLHDVAAGPGVFLVVGDDGEIRQTFDGSAFFETPARGPLRREQWLSADYADRDHAAVGGAGGVLVLADDAGPGPTIAVSGRGSGINARRRGGRVRLRIRGRLAIPAGLARAQACLGRVHLTVKRGRPQLASGNATVRSSCRFSTTLSLSRRAVGAARRLSVIARFEGNAVLGARTRTFRVRVRR